ncbi:MAG TPA: FMN-dependent NADH-azoreductase [Leptolyngbyaceae cyanobacterium M33_DOE_097]|uniref:FMN dependent NADH:quinone oxidoreductase n=1 Tax=Oscillatoriales cyanobacterium SpSt-418 TaxID=2282169 RepID=A0A7C3KF74_9CYAN|nr:FMN-dependent NADH-azoreductase [Leptolyngbyaceae cyanobacterium M33_DOE_097]
MHLLHIDSSPRSERSHSRRLTKEFVERWVQAHPNTTVTYRDLGHHPVPFIDELWIAAAFTPMEQHTPDMRESIRLSDQLVDEFLAADVYVIGAPMYNFSVSAAFKAYIDQLVRVGRTVAFEPQDAANVFKPLVLGKKMFVVEARGDSGFQPGGRYEKMNFHDPYLTTVFGFIGVTDITFVHVENDEYGGHKLAESIAQARHQIAQLVAS